MSTFAFQPFQTGHVGLNVTNLDRSKTFYQAVFGFETMAESDDQPRRFAFLGDGQRIFLTLWQQSAGHFAKNQPGLHHLSFEVGSLEQITAFEHKLRELQVPLLYDGIVAHREGAASGGLFFEDPDGIRLEIYSPTGLETHATMVTDGPACGFF
jgi:catechol 2,3-dioxygenase-like lactoylglutathione lyase family enzyme